ncbi:MAG: hypothetical protein INR71_01035 [Terriglobus roseus]|nr:hypothetical protein [Terriglobus roseus]
MLRAGEHEAARTLVQAGIVGVGEALGLAVGLERELLRRRPSRGAAPEQDTEKNDDEPASGRTSGGMRG